MYVIYISYFFSLCFCDPISVYIGFLSLCIRAHFSICMHAAMLEPHSVFVSFLFAPQTLINGTTYIANFAVCVFQGSSLPYLCRTFCPQTFATFIPNGFKTFSGVLGWQCMRLYVRCCFMRFCASLCGLLASIS